MLDKKGHSILVIEHNLDLIKCGDWLLIARSVAVLEMSRESNWRVSGKGGGG
jgi:hypothetical protein